MAETNCTLRKSRTKNWRKTAISITDGDGASLQQHLQYKFGLKGIFGGAAQIGKHSTNNNLGERQKKLYKFFFHRKNRKNKPFAQTKFINMRTHRPSLSLYNVHFRLQNDEDTT